MRNSLKDNLVIGGMFQKTVAELYEEYCRRQYSSMMNSLKTAQVQEEKSKRQYSYMRNSLKDSIVIGGKV